MRTEFISQKTTRRLLLHAQLLDRRTKLGAGTAGVAKAIDHLGYVQIDSISVIERAHQHTLWTRVPGYRPEHLHQAQAVERSIFEYWGHAASYLPMGDYRFYLPMMRSFYDPANSWYRGWAEKFGAYLAPVLERVRAEGPLASRDFENPIGLSPQGKGPGEKHQSSAYPGGSDWSVPAGEGTLVGLEAGQGGAGTVVLARRADGPRTARFRTRL